MIHIPEEPDYRQQQEQEEQERWLDEMERQKVRDIDEHMKRAFNEIFGGQDER